MQDYLSAAKSFQFFKTKEVHHFVSNLSEGSTGLYFSLMGYYYEEGFGFEADKNKAIDFYRKGAEYFECLCLERLSNSVEDKDFSVFLRDLAITLGNEKYSEKAKSNSDFLGNLFYLDMFEKSFGTTIINEIFWLQPLIKYHWSPNKILYNEVLRSFEYTLEKKISQKAGTITLLFLFLLHISDRNNIISYEIHRIKKIIITGAKYLKDLCEYIYEEALIIGILKQPSPWMQRIGKLYIEIGLSVRYFSKSLCGEEKKLMDEVFYKLSCFLFDNQNCVEDDTVKVFNIRFLSECFEKG